MPISIPKNELNEFSLPRVCVGTGQSGAVTFQKVQFQYIPRWIAIFAMAPLLYLIFYYLLRKTASGTMPFTDEAWQRVKAARRNVGLSILGLIVGMVAAGVLIGNESELGPLLLLGFLLAGIIGIVVASMRVRKVFPYATIIDDQTVTLTLPSPEAERLFTQHLTAGASAARG
jgi:hypothetical protein